MVPYKTKIANNKYKQMKTIQNYCRFNVELKQHIVFKCLLKMPNEAASDKLGLHNLEENAIKTAFPIAFVVIFGTLKRHAAEDLRVCE